MRNRPGRRHDHPDLGLEARARSVLGETRVRGHELQIASSTRGRIAAVGPLAVHGARHDAYAFEASGLKEIMAGISAVGDLGYVGVEGVDIVPIKELPRPSSAPAISSSTPKRQDPRPQRTGCRAFQELADDERGRWPLPHTHPQIRRNTSSDHWAYVLQVFCITFPVSGRTSPLWTVHG